MIDQSNFEYGIYFTSLEYNLKHKNTNISKTSFYYMDKIVNLISSLLDIYSNIENKTITTSNIVTSENVNLIHDLRKVMNFSNNEKFQKIGTIQIKKTMKILTLIMNKINEYKNNNENFYNDINKHEYELLLNFSHFMSKIYEDNNINVETSYKEETDYQSYAIL